MKKRAISSLLAVFVVAGFILPALATGSAGNGDQTETAQADADAVPGSFVLLDGTAQPVEYEVRSGTTYVTVSSFVAMADPHAVVREENGVVTVSSSQGEEALSLTVSTRTPYIIANGRCLNAKGSITTVNGHVAVPIRKLAQVFNLGVSYDSAAKAALLTRSEGSGAYIQSGDSYYNADTLYWLSRIIQAESGNQSLDGKIAVGNVVMNRVKSPLFPNSLYDVLNQPNQFIPCSTLSRYTPNSESVVAAKLVLEGVQVVPNALFFARAGLVCYASVYRPYVATIGAHAFYA